MPTEGEAVKPSVIDRIWLCPVHAEEFWVPHGGICPAVGCDRELRVYWALDEVLETLRSDDAVLMAVVGQHAVDGFYDHEAVRGAVEAATQFLERRFSGEGAS